MKDEEAKILAFTAVKIMTMADGTPRMLVEFDDASLAEVAKMFQGPRAPGAATALTVKETKDGLQRTMIAEEEKAKGGARSQWLAVRLKEPVFLAWLECTYTRGNHTGTRWAADNFEDSSSADKWFKQCFGVKSKKELDLFAPIGTKFDKDIRRPYQEFIGNN